MIFLHVADEGLVGLRALPRLCLSFALVLPWLCLGFAWALPRLCLACLSVLHMYLPAAAGAVLTFIGAVVTVATTKYHPPPTTAAGTHPRDGRGGRRGVSRHPHGPQLPPPGEKTMEPPPALALLYVWTYL